MPRVTFDANRFGPATAIDAPGGGFLLDLCDEAHAPVPFSCRTANCGTCRVEVLGGHELLEPALHDEREVLSILASARPLGDHAPQAGVTLRLACQARVRPGGGLLRIGLADDP